MDFTHKNLKEIHEQIQEDLSLEYDELKLKYLGKKGLITQAFAQISSLVLEQKAQYGKEVNFLKNEVENILQEKLLEKNEYSTKQRIDPTAPFDINSDGGRPNLLDTKGSIHPLTKELEILTEIFKGMGFDVLESRQIDDDYHMFESLNFPKGHPARDMYEPRRGRRGPRPPGCGPRPR